MISRPSNIIKRISQTVINSGNAVGTTISDSLRDLSSRSFQSRRSSSPDGHSNDNEVDGSNHSSKSSKSNNNKQKKNNNGSKEQQRPQYLLERLGGMVALKSIVSEFLRRVTKDPTLAGFFHQADPKILSAHQERFFSLAFTKVNIPSATVVIRSSHQRLFAQGLCEDHFDIFVGHFAATMKDRGFGSEIVDEALAILRPIRDIFQQSSAEQRRAKRGNSCPQPGIGPTIIESGNARGPTTTTSAAAAANHRPNNFATSEPMIRTN